MSYVLTNIGEEYVNKNGLDGVSLDVGLYNDGTDSASDTTDIGDLTTEPTNSNYNRQTDTFSVEDINGDWGIDNDSQLSFDFSDQSSSETVDSYFLIANFQSTEAGDGGATDHIIVTGGLSQDRDIGSIDTLNISAGDGTGNGLGVTLD